MKRAKLLRLIKDVQDAQRVGTMPTTFDTLSVNFDDRTLRFRGRTISVEPGRVASFPVLSTDRLIITKDGSEVI